MYLSLSPTTILSYSELVGIFDLDNVSTSHRTRAFLTRAEREGELTAVGEDLPRSLVVCAPPWGGQRLFLAQLSPATLRGRIQNDSLYDRP